MNSNEISEGNNQRKIESPPLEQKAIDDAEDKAKQKADQNAKKKAEREERKRREAALSKAKKEQSKHLAQRSATKTPKKENSGWVIIPGQTQKTY